jgi:phosphoglycerate dehydrogenase-like enzyme
MAIALDQRESRWTKRMSVPLAGKTLGILGLAPSTGACAQAAALEMRVIGTKRSPAPLGTVAKVYAQKRPISARRV